jgi:hypothetical protein
MMKINKWTLGLAAVGLVSIPSALQAEEKLSPLQTALSSTVISGYISTSMHWNPGTAKTGAAQIPPAYAFNTPAKQDGFNINVVDITIEKPLDEGTWSAGYKVELWIGPDAAGFNNATAATATPGTPGPAIGVGGDLALKQAYVSLRVPVGNGLDLKVGTFDTIIGYEVANAGSNPNYTRSYGYSIEPTQHTGVLASYQVNKAIGLTAGIANTHNSGLSTRPVSPGSGRVNESFKTYMGAVTLTAPDSFGSLAGSALYFGVVSGPNTSIAAPGPTVTTSSYYVGATLNTPVKGLKAGISYDYGYAPGVPVAGVNAQALALYLSYQATEKLSMHGRAEYFLVGTGIPVGALPPGVPSEALAFTGTIQYDLWSHVISRLEVRWDHSTAGATGLPKPFNLADKNAFLVAANIIYKF